MQYKIIATGDAFKTSLRLVADPTTSVEDRKIIVEAMQKLNGLALTPDSTLLPVHFGGPGADGDPLD